MRSFALFGLLAAGVSAVALPQDPPERFQGRFRGWHRHHGRPHPSVSVSNSLGNSTQPTPTAGGGSPSQTFASTVSIQTGSSSGLPTVSLSIGNTQPAPTSAGGSPSQIFVTATPTQTESGGALPTGNSTSGSGDASSNISFINSMDTAYGIPKKTWSSQLADNAYKTVKDDHGNVENHELNPGSMAQVISPGRDSPAASLGSYGFFEIVYLSWLCEVPTDSQLGGKCDDILSKAGLYVTGTGHHDILTSPDYTQIGCAYYADDTKTSDDGGSIQGLWACDLA